MLPLLIALPALLAAPSRESPPEYPVCPVSGYPYREGSGIFLTVRGHRYWTCHATHAEALAKHPEQYLDEKGVPKVLAHPSGERAGAAGPQHQADQPVTSRKDRP